MKLFKCIKAPFILGLIALASCNIDKKGTLTDIDGTVYQTLQIGTQEWMTENLNVGRFKNGDIIQEAKTLEEFEAFGLAGQPAWCYYDCDLKNGKKYGKLYNWYAVNDPRGLAPNGSHIPSEAEWSTLISSASDGANDTKMAANALMNTTEWSSPVSLPQDIIANNKTQFNALPGGAFTSCGSGGFACFDGIGYSAHWWTSTKSEGVPAARFIYIDLQFGDKMGLNDWGVSAGLSIRCIKDESEPSTYKKGNQSSENDNETNSPNIFTRIGQWIDGNVLNKNPQTQSEKLSEVTQEVKTLFFEQQVGRYENQTAIYKLTFKGNKIEIIYKYLDYDEMKPEYAELINGKIVVPENHLSYDGQKRDEVITLKGNELCIYNPEGDGFDCYSFIRTKSTHGIEETMNPDDAENNISSNKKILNELNSTSDKESNVFKGQTLKSGERIVKINWGKENKVKYTKDIFDDETRYSSKSLIVPNGKKWILIYIKETYTFESGSWVSVVPDLFIDNEQHKIGHIGFSDENNINLSRAKDENIKIYSASSVKAVSSRTNGKRVGDNFIDYKGEMWFLEIND
jgi:uncharacterized protein (TIGR02145 family)